MRHASLLVGLVALGIPGLGLGATDEGARLSLPPSEWMAKGEAAVLAVPDFYIYATSANFGRFGLQAWPNWHPRHAHPRTGYATQAFTGARHLHSHPIPISKRSRLPMDRFSAAA